MNDMRRLRNPLEIAFPRLKTGTLEASETAIFRISLILPENPSRIAEGLIELEMMVDESLNSSSLWPVSQLN